MVQAAQARSTLFGSLSQLGAGALAIIQSRLELFGIEWAEEYARAIGLLILIAAAAVLGFMALLVASLLVVFAFDGTARLVAMAIVAAVYLLLAAGCVLAVKQGLVREAPPFAATLAELKRDRAMLMKSTVSSGDSDA